MVIQLSKCFKGAMTTPPTAVSVFHRNEQLKLLLHFYMTPHIVKRGMVQSFTSKA